MAPGEHEATRTPRPGPGVVEPARGPGDPDADLWEALLRESEPRAFQAAWLTLLCRRIGGVAAAVLVLEESEDFRPVAAWPSSAKVAEPVARAVERALATQRAVTFVGDSGGGSEARHVLAEPLLFEGELRGAVACELVGISDEGELRRAVQILRWGSAWIDLGRQRDASQLAVEERERLLAVLELASTVAERENFRRSATALATELAVRLGCDRVSLGFVEHQRVRLRAVSHTAIFEGRSNLSRSVEQAMEEAFDQEAIVALPATAEQFQVRVAHEALMELGSSKAVASVPFGRDHRTYGIITLERSSAVPFTQRELDLVDVVGSFAGPLLELERQQSLGLFALLLGALRRLWRKLLTPGSPVFKGALVTVLLLVVLFSFLEGTYRVTADAVLEAEQQRVVVAPFGGYVAEAPLRAGDIVKKGDLLCRLDARDLELERGRLRSQNDQYQKLYNQALAQRDAAQINIIRSQIDQIAAQLELVGDQLERTRVVSPIDGMVVEGDLSQALASPVERGEVLFQVAPLDEMRIVLLVDERDIEFVAPGQTGGLVLTSLPNETFSFEVSRVTPVSSALEGTNAFRVEASIAGALGRLRPGMKGIGKVETEERLLIWNWTHEAVDWWRLFVWRWGP